MSFSAKVKKELSAVTQKGRHCKIAELSAILCSNGRVFIKDSSIKLQTDNLYIAKKFYQIVKSEFNLKCGIQIKKSGQHNKISSFILTAEGEETVRNIIYSTNITVRGEGVLKKKISALVIKDACCKASYLRGVFLCCGSITEPSKNNHLEMATGEAGFTKSIVDIFEQLGLEFAPKTAVRKGRYIIYFKDGEQISGVLSALGAFNTMMEYENSRILKEVNNKINRQVNFQNANMEKAISAALTHINDILFIEETEGLSSLPENLEEIARSRLNNPEMSLKEIGLLLNPPVGKSGVNHRLRKLSQIANDLRNV